MKELNVEEIIKKFVDRFGVTPEEEMGEDWQDHLEEYYKNANDEDERIDQ